ncbi:Bug family tripartite tricarboxylate transporter substrate binding protein [Rhodoferax saidenbachensis]|uniref:Tripartite tricarboxylate transporter receptor protein n=1 Tax=Rhodoferax saidenbachensis TaxID=1484693 RepID=A0A1P8KBA1_9BURK|nr:tripartite tricarboxylate transporter substrate binding protein [Rhodoferax saidenbachensis]APW43304.1 tripartite tricarboxylate transporter receptor protein [Rhodoferax saidenbachensis]
MKRLKFTAILAGAILGLGTFAVAPAMAQAFPSKPIRIVVPFGAGGVADLTARTVAQKMSESLGQPVVIDNKPGAGGVVAGDTVAKADPDGHTLLLMSNGTAVSAGLFKSLPFDALRDFAPVSTLGYFDLAVLASPTAPFKTMTELLAYAKAHPGKLNVGTINIGSTQNLAAELFKSRTGLDFLIVPFNGTPAVITALRGGQVDVAVEILGPMMGQVQSKAVSALAVMGDARAPQLPDVPTLMQSGVKDFDVSSWNALAAPAKTPKDVIARLNKEAQAALASPDVKKRLYELNVQARGSSPEKLGELLSSEIKRWSEVINKAGVPKL